MINFRPKENEKSLRSAGITVVSDFSQYILIIPLAYETCDPLSTRSFIGHGLPIPQHLASGGLTMCALFFGSKDRMRFIVAMASLINSIHIPLILIFTVFPTICKQSMS
jgi:hypothetical protein